MHRNRPAAWRWPRPVIHSGLSAMSFQNAALPRPMIADGAVRSRLALLNPAPEAPVEALNLTHAAQVQAVHESFLAAGALLHRTNTRDANGVALRAAGLEARCEAINNSGSALVRAAVGQQGYMMGAIGQILPDADGAPAPVAERDRAYAEQIIYLADTGVTFVLLEHFGNLEEALRVLRIARDACDAPVLAQLRFDSRGRTEEGLTCGEAARRLVDAGAEALGIGCGPAPENLPPLLAELLHFGLPVSVMPGVRGQGLPPPYPEAPELSPAAFAEVLAGLAEQGAAIVGGCCGVTPEHIRALAERLGGAAPGQPG